MSNPTNPGTDPSVDAAREYLAAARRRSATQLPRQLLMRDLAESRRLLAGLLEVINGQAADAADGES